MSFFGNVFDFEKYNLEGIGRKLKCRIPDDHIDSRRYPLFMARSAMRELIETLRPTGKTTRC